MLCVLRMRVLPRFPGLNPLTLPVISYVTLGRSCKFSVPQILPLLEEGPVFSRSFPALSQGQQDKRERQNNTGENHAAHTESLGGPRSGGC